MKSAVTLLQSQAEVALTGNKCLPNSGNIISFLNPDKLPGQADNIQICFTLFF